jgi:hypothetical protein
VPNHLPQAGALKLNEEHTASPAPKGGGGDTERPGQSGFRRPPLWTFLSDPGRHVHKDLDIAEYMDPEHNPMIPHVTVLQPRLVIFTIYIG